MEKPEALRLADIVERNSMFNETAREAAAELRRLHAENEAIHQAITDPENQPSQFGTVTFAMYEALEAQRDALLEALKLARLMLIAHGEKHAKFDAAIAKAEEKT